MAVQNLSSKKSNFVSYCKNATTQFLDSYEKLKAFRQEWTSEGYSGAISQDDINGDNAHITPGILGNLMNTFDVIESLINSNTPIISGNVGYLTNLYNMKP